MAHSQVLVTRASLQLPSTIERLETIQLPQFPPETNYGQLASALLQSVQHDSSGALTEVD